MSAKLLRPILTAVCAIGLTLIVWMLLVMLLDRRVPFDVWAVSLWVSAICCTAVVAYSRFAVKPVLACTIAFGLFSLAFLAAEGPIFGDVAKGGDPATTNVVVWNLVALPIGVFVASEVGSVLGAMRRKKTRVAH